MKLKLLSIVLCATLLVPTIHVSAKPQPKVPSVYLDGERLSFTTNPIIENGSTLVPMRIIFEKQGANVNWNQENQTVTATKDEVSITYTIGEKQAKVNGKASI